MEFVRGFYTLLLYFGIAACAAMLLRLIIDVPHEWFRKILHFILLGSLVVLTSVFTTWRQAALGSLLFMFLVFPLLKLAEGYSGYSALLTERRSGEVRQSLVIVFSMFALLIAFLWGYVGEKFLVWASIYAWGFGDAAAALVGTRFGRHRLPHVISDGKKSWEGTIAMFAVSFLTVGVILALFSSVGLGWSLMIALLTALVTAAVELVSTNGLDTLTCPVAAAAVLVPMLELGRRFL